MVTKTLYIKTILFLLFLPCLSLAQIPKDAKVIIVKNISFLDVANALLDKGYNIEKKDNELQTLRTEKKDYPKYWNATYIIDVRVKDSVAYISGSFTAPPGGGLFKDEPIIYLTNKKGEPLNKSVSTFPFIIINEFATSLNKELEYK